MKKEKKVNLMYTLIQAFFWSNAAVIFTYAVFYLQNAGCSKSGIGLTVSAANIVSIFLSLNLSTAIDKRNGKNIFGIVNVLLLSQVFLQLFLMTINDSSIFTAIAYSLVMCLSLAINPVYTKLFINSSLHNLSINYSIARSVGSLAFAVTSFLTGKLISEVNVSPFHVICLICLVLQITLTARLRKEYNGTELSKTNETDADSLLSFIRGNPHLLVLFIGIALIFSANHTIGTFLFSIVENIGGSVTELGFLNGFMVLFETAAMFVYGKIQIKNVKKVLIFSIMFFPVKIILTSVAHSTQGLFFAAAFQALSFGLYTPAIVDYLNKTTERRNSAKSQTLALNMQTIGTVIATTISGYFLDIYDLENVLFGLSTVSIIGVCVCLLSFRIKLRRMN